MKILILSNFGMGMFKFRLELVKKLLDEKHEVIISFPRDEYANAFIEIGCAFFDSPLDRRGINPIKDIELIFNYHKLIKKVKPDLVFSYTIKPNIYGGLVSRINKVPFIPTVTGLGSTFQAKGALHLVITLLYKFSIRKSKCIIFQNRHNKEIFEKKIFKHQNSIIVSGSGVNIDNYQYIDYPKNNGVTRFIYVGRIMKDKGIDELLKAARILLNDRYNVTFDFVGFCESGYDEVIDRHVREGIITFHGPQKDVKQYIAQSHALVLPSHHEGLSNVLLEASAIGRPVIASNIPGCIETFEDRVTGFSFEVRDTQSLLITLKEFISLEYQAKENMGINARKKIISDFNRNDVVQQYLNQINIIKGEKR